MSEFELKSPAFCSGGAIPEVYAQAGRNISPPLEWRGLPPDAKSLVLLVEDFDAPVGTVTHWAVHGLDPSRRSLEEGVHAIRQAANDMGHARYDGPKPPPGPGHGPHRYRFRLSALDVESLHLPEHATHQDLKKAARTHALAEAQLVGIFETPARGGDHG